MTYNGGSIYSPIGVLTLILLGLLFIASGYLWPPSRPETRTLLTNILEPLAIHFPWIIGAVVLMFWLSTLGPAIRARQITSLQKNLHSAQDSLHKEIATLRADFNCYAKPRRLKSEQISKIAAYLSAHDPQEITFNVVSDDNEASNYRADIDNALRQGGWKILGYNYLGQNFPCHGTSSLRAGLVEVTAWCLSPGEAMLALTNRQTKVRTQLRYVARESLRRAIHPESQMLQRARLAPALPP
jgi:hypothetical protein